MTRLTIVSALVLCWAVLVAAAVSDAAIGTATTDNAVELRTGFRTLLSKEQLSAKELSDFVASQSSRHTPAAVQAALWAVRTELAQEVRSSLSGLASQLGTEIGS